MTRRFSFAARLAILAIAGLALTGAGEYSPDSITAQPAVVHALVPVLDIPAVGLDEDVTNPADAAPRPARLSMLVAQMSDEALP